MDELSDEEQKRLVKAGSLVAIAYSILGVSWLYFFVVSDRFGLREAMLSGTSAFAAARMILPIMYVIWIVPGAVMSESADSWVKKRDFRPRNILFFFAFFGEAVLAMAAFLTLFDLILPKASFLIQFPLIVVSLSMAILVMVLTLEKTGIKSRFKKAFDK